MLTSVPWMCCVTVPCWLRGYCGSSSRNRETNRMVVAGIILRRIYVTDGFGHGRVVGHRAGDGTAARGTWASRVRHDSQARRGAGERIDEGGVGRPFR